MRMSWADAICPQVHPGQRGEVLHRAHPPLTRIQVDQEMLFEIILAANYLDIKPLL